MRRLYCALVAINLLWLASCGTTSTTPMVSLSPGLPQTLEQGTALDVKAAVSNDPSNKGVTWSLTPVLGSLSNQTSTSVIYQAPDSVTTNAVVTITATSVANSGEATPLVISVLAPGEQNVQPISVNGGPLPGRLYLNGPFTSVVICAAGTSQCQSIDGILVDTGSVGLRLFKSLLTVPLKPVTQSGGSVNNCISFVGQQFLWGEVASADVYLAGETASGISVQLIADPTSFAIPTSCSNGDVDADSQEVFGANGLLGVGDEPTDCTFSGANPCNLGATGAAPPAYFVCFDGEGCAATQMPIAQQVMNPIAAFPRDNNGSILQFPSVGTAMSTANGTMTFGINTEPNNSLGTATVFAISSQNNFTTVFSGQQLTNSFIDSGSNMFFFPNITGLQLCSDSPFYCPANPPVALSATNEGANSLGSGPVDFQVDSFDSDTQSNPNDAAFGYVAGPNGTSPCQNGKGACSFDWGLPFFYNRSVFTSIDLQTVANEPKTPWWAY